MLRKGLIGEKELLPQLYEQLRKMWVQRKILFLIPDMELL